jgi:hypothetical protein
MAGIFDQLVQNMSRMGFFQFLFPFLLALAIVYGLLTWALEKQIPKSARALVSLIAAFFVMLYSSWNVMVVQFFANLFGPFLAVATGILVIVMLFALVGFKVETLTHGKYSKWVLVLLMVFIGIVLFFGAGASYLIDVPGFAMNSDFFTVIFFIIILAVVMFWLSKEGESDGSAAATAAGGAHK